MRLLWIINPGAHKRNKYQGKIAKAQWKDMRHQRSAERHEVSQQRQAELHDKITAQITGQTSHDFPWWREPTLASLIGRRHQN